MRAGPWLWVDRLLDKRDDLLNNLNKMKEKQGRSYQTMYTRRDWRVMTVVDAALHDLHECERVRHPPLEPIPLSNSNYTPIKFNLSPCQRDTVAPSQ